MPMESLTFATNLLSIFQAYTYVDDGELLFSPDASLAKFDLTAAASAWARAYRRLAETASVPFGVPVQSDLLVAEATLAGSLAAAFTAGMVNSVPLASPLASAYEAFWLTPPLFVGAAEVRTGVVTAVTGTAALAAFLGARMTLAVPLTADEFAEALKTFTMTVVVTEQSSGTTATLV